MWQYFEKQMDAKGCGIGPYEARVEPERRDWALSRGRRAELSVFSLNFANLAAPVLYLVASYRFKPPSRFEIQVAVGNGID